ncbi:hypothetical protein GALL_520940 [mine drainage metagenome]|uniref:Uncharacterized protein n=1 Tax=mine drainage metagenome TaxID=410659 RepID=A0A1J5P582_9ZZZZ
MHPLALGLNDHANTISALVSTDGFDRRAEIRHIKTPAQPFRQGGFHEFNDQRLPLLMDIDPHLVIGQGHHHPASAVFSAAKINITQRQCVTVEVFSKNRHGPSGLRIGHRVQKHQQGFALNPGFVRCVAFQIEYHTGPATRLNHAG